MVSHMNSHHKTFNKIPIGLHIQHALSPAMLTGPLSMLQQQRHLTNVKMYQFCGGNANYMRISYSHPKPSFTMKMRDLSFLLILFREVLAKFSTMLMAAFTLVLQMALHVQCIHWHGMIQWRNAWLFKQLQNLHQAR
jgi:hypothetical protein